MPDDTIVDMKARVEARKAMSPAATDKNPPAASIDQDRKLLDRILCSAAHDADEGLARLYAHKMRNRFVYAHDAGIWYFWHPAAGHWHHDYSERHKAAVSEIADLLSEYANTRYRPGPQTSPEDYKQLQKFQSLYTKAARYLRTDRGRKNCLNFAHSLPHGSLSCSTADFDKDPDLLVTPTGTIDLRTAALRPSSPVDMNRKCTSAPWKGLDCPAPLWRASLLQIFDGDTTTVDFLQRLFGYAITGHQHEGIFAFLYGEHGRSGKSTLMSMLGHVLGTYKSTHEIELLLKSRNPPPPNAPRAEILALSGSRVSQFNEPESNRSFAMAMLKLLTGGDTITARGPHDKSPVSFWPSHTIFILSNPKPSAPASDSAFWQRLIPVRFPLSFRANHKPLTAPHHRHRDKFLIDKLRHELSGILAWLVQGSVAYYLNGLDIPRHILNDRADYKRENDDFADWLSECTTPASPGTRVSATALYDSFKAWWEKNVRPTAETWQSPPSQKKFGQYMAATYQSKKSGVYYYYGLRMLQS